jgi:hypothetical protein
VTAVADRILRSFALVVTDRRWAAPLSAMALGFGIFVGVAVGPEAAGTMAGPPLIVRLPAPAEEPVEAETGGGGESPVLAGPASEGGSGGEPIAALPAPPAPAPAPEKAPAAKEKPAPEPREAEEEEEEVEETIPLEGAVVHDNPAAGSYAIAIKGGELISIHAAKLPEPGTKLKLAAARLENGTFEAAERPKTLGKTASVSFRGIVTYVDSDPAAPAYTVSGRGSSILVRVRPDPSGAAPSLPALYSYATVTASVEKASAASALPVPAPPATEAAGTTAPAPTCAPEPGQAPLKSFQPTVDLWQQKIESEAEPATYLDLAGMIAAVCPATDQILLSADDTRASGQDLSLKVGPKIDAAKLRVGESFLATATVEPDGSLTLAGVASDEQIKGADDAKSAQGDLKH